jgi:hypothetical protein
MKVPRLRFALMSFLGFALAVAGGIAVTIWPSSRSRIQVTTCDPRLRALSAKLLCSSKDCFYIGNQAEGRVRDLLRTRLHFKVKPLEDMAPYADYAISAEYFRPRAPSPRQAGYPAILALRFSLLDPTGSLPPVPPAFPGAPAPPITLELQDPSGDVVPGGCLCYSGTNPFYMLLNLDTERTRAGTYKVRLLRTDVCLAEVEIRDLPPLTPLKLFPVFGTNAFPFLGKDVL